jgi:hypothetical protein
MTMDFEPANAPESGESSEPLSFGRNGNVSHGLQEFFDRNVGNAFDRCVWVSNLLIRDLGNQFRQAIDVRKGMVRFAESHAPDAKHIDVECKIIGILLQDGLFIWAWDPELAPLPIDLGFANQLKLQLGHEQGIGEFTRPSIQFRSQLDIDAFNLSIQGWANSDSYFNLKFDNMMIVAFLAEHSFDRKIIDPSRRVRQYFPEILARCPVYSHRLAFECYLESLGFDVARNGVVSKGTLGHFWVEARFDKADQLVEMTKPE